MTVISEMKNNDKIVIDFQFATIDVDQYIKDKYPDCIVSVVDSSEYSTLFLVDDFTVTKLILAERFIRESIQN